MRELVATALSAIGYRDAYHMWPKPLAARFRALVRASTQQDPEWTARFLRWLRVSTPMRYAALVGAAQFVGERIADGQHGMSRQVVESVLVSADDPGHLLAYWVSTYGAKVPKPVKRGVADAMERMAAGPPLAPTDVTLPAFLGLRRLEKHQRPPRPLRLRDVIALTHPKTNVPPRFAQRPVVGRPGLRGLDRVGWDRCVAEMSLPQLLVSLRRFDWVGIPFETAMTVAGRISDRDEVLASGVGPMRYFAAWRAVATQRWPLATGAGHSVEALPRIPGRTLLVIDSNDTVAVMFGLVLAQLCEHAEVCGQSGQSFDVIAGESPLHAVTRWEAGGFEYRDIAVPGLSARLAGHDRVIDVGFSSSEFRNADSLGGAAYYAWYTSDHGGDYEPDQPWLEFRGCCDESLSAISLIEAAGSGRWPWELTAA